MVTRPHDHVYGVVTGNGDPSSCHVYGVVMVTRSHVHVYTRMWCVSEANRNLTWRDMQHIVVATSNPQPLQNEEGKVTRRTN
jgi:hypothetical protein